MNWGAPLVSLIWSIESEAGLSWNVGWPRWGCARYFFGGLGQRSRNGKTASAECAARHFEASGAIDVVELLPQVKVLTLVMHTRGDAQVPFELGRHLAAGIPRTSRTPK